MPLVKRKIMVEVKTTGAVTPADVIEYVNPKDVLETDVIVKPTPRQLRELAEIHTEYRAAAAKLAAESGLTGAQFSALGWDQGVAAVESTDDETMLVRWFGFELERPGGPRKSLLEAFAKKGLAP